MLDTGIVRLESIISGQRTQVERAKGVGGPTLGVLICLALVISNAIIVKGPAPSCCITKAETQIGSVGFTITGREGSSGGRKGVICRGVCVAEHASHRRRVVCER